MDAVRLSVSPVAYGKSAEKMPDDPTQHDELCNTDEKATVPAEQERQPGEEGQRRHW